MSRQALLVLYDNGYEQVQKDENWIRQGLVQRNYSGRVLNYNPDNPSQVASSLGAMAMFLAGRMGNNDPNGVKTEEQAESDEKFFHQLKRVLGPAMKQMGKDIWKGKQAGQSSSSS